MNSTKTLFLRYKYYAHLLEIGEERVIQWFKPLFYLS